MRSRADRPSRMLVEISRDPSFRRAHTLRGPLLPRHRGTGKLRVPGSTKLAWVLCEIARRRVRNVVRLTADVHDTAAHHYSPDRAAVGDFGPFWEFVSDRSTRVGSGPTRSTSRSLPRPCSCPRRTPPDGGPPALR